jgi:hypothetical protein
MRLMLHTFKKDARRLWPAAAATWVMLAALANADRWRADWIPSPMEGWMNLLLTMAWVCLAALAVLEEPLVGDRNFWTTRPHRWPALLVAKLVFVVLAIHLPSLLADIFVLTARGFSPSAHLGGLLWKQMLFFGTVTLPSIALASLVRNFTNFVIAVFAIAAGIAILNGGFQRFPEFRGQESEVRHVAVRSPRALWLLPRPWLRHHFPLGFPCAPNMPCAAEDLRKHRASHCATRLVIRTSSAPESEAGSRQCCFQSRSHQAGAENSFTFRLSRWRSSHPTAPASNRSVHPPIARSRRSTSRPIPSPRHTTGRRTGWPSASRERRGSA